MCALLSIALWSLAAGPERPQPLATLAPHAAGLCLAEVTDLKTFDTRPSDGPRYVRVALRVRRRSGAVPDHLSIITAYGGIGPPGAPRAPRLKPLRPDSLQKGERYWFAFASVHDHDRHPQGVINFWPEKSPAAKALDAAVRSDALAWSPQYYPKLGVSYGYKPEPAQDRWRVRVEKGGKILWETVLPGKKSERYAAWYLFPRDSVADLQWADRTATDTFLVAETGTALGKDNEYGLPAGKYYVSTAYDVDTGKRAAARVALLQDSDVECVFRAYDLKSGKVRREHRYDWLETGGKAVGAKTDSWLRRVERTFDVTTGRVTREEAFRHAQVEVAPGVQESRWVRVAKPQ
jgi:hypothetical protein